MLFYFGVMIVSGSVITGVFYSVVVVFSAGFCSISVEFAAGSGTVLLTGGSCTVLFTGGSGAVVLTGGSGTVVLTAGSGIVLLTAGSGIVLLTAGVTSPVVFVAV